MTFSSRLRAASRLRGVSMAELSRRTGISVSGLKNLAQGKTLWPKLETVQTISEALDYDLTSLVVRERTRECVICKGPFVAMSNSTGKRAQVTCRNSCKVIRNQRMAAASQRKRYNRRVKRVNRLERNRLTELQQAVMQFCNRCEPEGTCHNASCEIRPGSHLPLGSNLIQIDRRVA